MSKETERQPAATGLYQIGEIQWKQVSPTVWRSTSPLDLYSIGRKRSGKMQVNYMTEEIGIGRNLAEAAMLADLHNVKRLEPDLIPHEVTQCDDEELVAKCNALARLFYKSLGYDVDEGYRFDQARHPQELGMWNQACIAFEELLCTDMENALSNCGD